MKDIDPATKEAIRSFIKLIDTKYDIFDVILFGSRSRCTHEVDSDVDIAILLKGEPQRMIPVKLEMKDIADDVYLETGLDISPLPIWIEEWQHPEHYSKTELIRKIAKEGISLKFKT